MTSGLPSIQLGTNVLKNGAACIAFRFLQPALHRHGDGGPALWSLASCTHGPQRQHVDDAVTPVPLLG
jgi:hypothetical protein